MSSSSSNLRPITSKQKFAEVKAALRQLAEQNPPGTKLPTVRELCRQLNVAIATLDSALQSLEDSGIITRRRGSGIYVGSGISQKAIGVIFGINIFEIGASPVFREILRQCQHRAETHNERFSFYIDIDQWDNQPGRQPLPAHSDLVQDLNSGRLDGALLLWPTDARQDRWVRSHSLPVISLECDALQKNGGVRLDYNVLQRIGVQALLDKGCRRIGFIQNLMNLPSVTDLLSSHGALSHSDWIWRPSKPIIEMSSTNEKIGFQVAKRMLTPSPGDSHGTPDGLVILDDMITRGALVALRKLGLQPGKDIHIATHANKGSSTLYGYEDELIFLEFDPEEIVETLFQMLESCWETNAPAPSRILLPKVIRLQ
jgi:DNA-binding LacI/PurR family transcriptional regulator